MKVIYYRDAEAIEEVKGVSRRDVITREDGAPTFSMRVFEVEAGSSTPSHSHPFEHEVFILTGRGVVVGNEGAISIGKESVVFVASGEPHCFVNTGNEPLRFVCVIPVQQEC